MRGAWCVVCGVVRRSASACAGRDAGHGDGRAPSPSRLRLCKERGLTGVIAADKATSPRRATRARVIGAAAARGPERLAESAPPACDCMRPPRVADLLRACFTAVDGLRTIVATASTVVNGRAGDKAQTSQSPARARMAPSDTLTQYNGTSDQSRSAARSSPWASPREDHRRSCHVACALAADTLLPLGLCTTL